MPDMVRMESSQVRELAADLGRVPAKSVPAVDQVMKRGANNVKRDMRRHAEGHPTFPHFPRSISYDRVPSEDERITYEIGPDKDRMQGALGNLLYFGSSNNAPVLDIEHGLRDEAPRLERHLGEVAAGLLGM